MNNQQERLIIEGLCPKCNDRLGFKRAGVWECQNPECKMLVFYLEEGEVVYRSTCQSCDYEEWGVGPTGIEKATCPNCQSPCTLIPEEDWQE